MLTRHLLGCDGVHANVLSRERNVIKRLSDLQIMAANTGSGPNFLLRMTPTTLRY